MSAAAHESKVLIVDDRVENLIATESVLRSLPAELVRAGSGNEALALVLRHEFAVALLDVQMPGMDGFEVASLMRSSERTKHVPIILMTAFGAVRQRIWRGYETGAVDFLFKPIDPVILKSKVDVFLRLDRQSRDQRRAKLELERAKSELESFVRATSHDLREPVRTLRVSADLLEESASKKLDERDRALLAALRQRAERILSQLDALAEYADVGEACEWERINLEETAESVIAQLAEPIRAAGAQIEIGELPVVEGHAGQLRALFRHLLSNALKFRREGTPPRVRISGEPVGSEEVQREGLQPGGRYFALSVRDNGLGLREGEGKRLFGAFIHLQNREVREGAHLGLAVCRRIVERHRGSICAEGRVGEGTTVRVVLPVQPQDAA